MTTTPPSPEELAKQGFLLPEIPRITYEQIKQMMDRGDALVLVDARPEWDFKSVGGNLIGLRYLWLRLYLSAVVYAKW